MEGRVLPRPNVNDGLKRVAEALASMEGRVLPRPNSRRGACGRHPRRGFNGGSGITPTEYNALVADLMEYAGFNGGSGITPTESVIVELCQASLHTASMEGRVLPRPNVSDHGTVNPCLSGFNGGSGITPTECSLPSRMSR